MKENVYQANGYKNRRDYLQQTAEEYGTDFETVETIAAILGETEDFDGLLSALEDLEQMF